MIQYQYKTLQSTQIIEAEGTVSKGSRQTGYTYLFLRLYVFSKATCNQVLHCGFYLPWHSRVVEQL